jgi:hypothetical protein
MRNVSYERLRAAAWVITACMIIGAIGPWAKASVFGLTVTANGFDRDGAIVLACGVIIATGLVVVQPWARLVRLIAALVSAGVCIYDYFDVAGTTGVSVGWGLWLALIASVAAVVVFFELRRRPAPDAAITQP